jgi:glutamate synthase domain-containing protein 1/glutamate synthase domain-containing protein 3
VSGDLQESLTASRQWMRAFARDDSGRMQEAEGGCGVLGIASSVPLPGRHILMPLQQMHNRGNGKGGGIAAVGLSPEQLEVDRRVLDEDYLIQVAFLKPKVRDSLEKEFIKPLYTVEKRYKVPTTRDRKFVQSLEVTPPEVWRYFCRAREEPLNEFIKENKLEKMDRRRAEDEFVYQTSFRINSKYYATSDMAAFVMSHGRNMIVMKIVGYAEDVIKFYKLEELTANIWIGHQRYPTKGRVWHPGGAHPFVGLDEALVHNGDFANYYSVSEYLAQRNVIPLFLTDTEVSVLLFDVLNRTYGYPLEYIIEALAPTTERDFHLLPEAKRTAYRTIQATHIHGSPDGPWFFIVGRNCFYDDRFQLMGITDTSMLRPQVFALVDGEVQLGLIASEKQAIDAALVSISADHPSVPRVADMYWNARGGSHTDGGAFIFSLFPEEGDETKRRLICTNKFGNPITPPYEEWDRAEDLELAKEIGASSGDLAKELVAKRSPQSAFDQIQRRLGELKGQQLNSIFEFIIRQASNSDTAMEESIDLLTLLIDKRYHTGRFRRSRIVDRSNEAISTILRGARRIEKSDSALYVLVDQNNKDKLSAPASPYSRLAINCDEFPAEGDEGVSFLISRARELGWNRVVLFGTRGHRFIGCGLGPKSKGLKIDVYGSPGDYLASGLDGAEMTVHANGQDQLGQILYDGRLVVHGDVGQTFLYGAKGGETYVLGNAAGRPLINAVGRPKVVINGTCLDYLAESFMAGNALFGGGFVVLNGLMFDAEGKPVDLPTPYPGGNLFSLASGGAIYVRDPKRLVGEDQLNGGRISRLTRADWELILPHLKENERLFGISVDNFLLKVDGVTKSPEEVYRKIEAVPLVTLAGTVQMQDTGS